MSVESAQQRDLAVDVLDEDAAQLQARLLQTQPHVPTRVERLAGLARPLEVEAAAEVDRAGGIQLDHGFPQAFGQGLEQLAVAVDVEPIGREVGEMDVPTPVVQKIASTLGGNLDRSVLGLAALERDVPVAVGQQAFEPVEAIREVDGLDRCAWGWGWARTLTLNFFGSAR